MRASAILQATGQRARRPRTWGAALLFGLVWDGGRWALGWPLPGPLELAMPALWVALLLVLGPVPWQWSGDEAPMAPTWRGGLQALPWMAALTLAVLVALGSLSGPGPGRGPGRGPGPGERVGERAGERGGPRHVEPPLGREEGRWLPANPRLWALGVTSLSLGLLLGWVLAEREGAEAQAAAAGKAADEARARALQGQLNPHVLFNAIGGLTELVREDPKAAEDALVSLSELLRTLLQHGSRLRGPLGDERRLVAHHLALERIRLGRRLRETWDWPESLDGLEVPPLMVQPLVENALKHGIAKAVGGGDLQLQVRRDGQRLRIRVANTGPAPEPGSEGIGLRNLRERLELLGASPETFQLTREGDWTVAMLELEVPA
jgi:hypothetical protein